MKNENKEGRARASPITLPSTKYPLVGPKQWTCAAKDCTCHLKPRIEALEALKRG